MKKLENKAIMYKGVQVTDEKNTPCTTLSLINVVLENAAYTSSAEVIKAAGIIGRVKVENNEIDLEDDDFNFIKMHSITYTPMLSKGLVFLDFFKQLE